MFNLEEVSNLLIFFIIFICLIMSILSFRYRGLKNSRNGLIYYSSLVFVLCMGIVVNFNMLEVLVRVFNGRTFIQIIILVLLIVIGYLYWSRLKKYALNNPRLGALMLYVDMFLIGMLIANFYEVFV